MQKRKVIAFDFDGTITNSDTLLLFIRFAKGTNAFFLGFLRYSHLLIAYKLNLYPNWKVKQKIFAHFFKGMDLTDFRSLGDHFATEIDRIIRPKALEAIQEALVNGDTIYVLTASIEDWVRPWCEKHGMYNVLGTQVEIDEHNRLTGRFSTPNCFGQEKVTRLLLIEPERHSYILHAYGNNLGDRELIEFSDEGWYNKFE